MFCSTEPMKTKAETTFTVNLQGESVKVSKTGDLIAFYTSNGDTLHLFLDVDGRCALADALLAIKGPTADS